METKLEKDEAYDNYLTEGLRKATEAEHTPTPWVEVRENQIEGPQDQWIATCEHSSPYCVSKEEALANAAFIVRAANSFDNFIKACNMALDEIKGGGNREGTIRFLESMLR